MPSPAATLRSVLSQRFPDGRRVAVPVVGTGIHAAAGGGDDWAALLRRVANEAWKEPVADGGDVLARIPAEHVREPFQAMVDAGTLPHSATAQWEHLLCEIGSRDGVPGHECEGKLQKIVCSYLREFEAEAVAGHREFYRAFIRAGYADVVSLNFDTVLSKVCDSAQKKATRIPGLSAQGRLSRHFVCDVEGVSTRVWHPHGDSALQTTLLLGVRRYGHYLSALETACREHFAVSYQHKHDLLGADPHTNFRAVHHLDQAPTWVDVFMRAPLVFVGCGLSPSEWTLWWLLHQRARLHLRYKPQPAVLVTAKSDTATLHGLQGAPAGVEALVFDTFDEVWEVLHDVGVDGGVPDGSA